MQTELHFGYRWKLNAEKIEEIKTKITNAYGFIEKTINKCKNEHSQLDGEYCKICGSKLKSFKSKEIVEDFEWWLVFDEQCFYMNGNTIYLSVDSGFCLIDVDDLTNLNKPDDELSEILNVYANPIPCAFVMPWIYNLRDEDQ